MTAKQYLDELHRIRVAAEILQGRAEVLRTQAEGLKAITYDKDPVQVSPSNVIEEAVIQLEEIERRYVAKVIEYQTALQERLKRVYEMEKPEHTEILSLRYIEEENGRHTLEEIAEIMHISYDRAKHLHGEALQAFYEQWLKS